MRRPARKLLRRAALAILVVSSTAAAALQMAHLLRVNGFTTLEHLVVVLFAASFAWVAFAFWTALAGALATLLGVWRAERELAPAAGDGQTPLSTRTAIVMPIYHEDPEVAFTNLEAVFLSVAATGQGDVFDFFILSDSQKPSRWLAEEVRWAELCSRRDASGRVFYRRRARNVGKKAGNIADFCARWGSRYDFMVILDADSLMAGETLVRMARLMEANPDVGIIQAPPLVVGRRTPFALLQQFASRVYGPVFAAGLSLWHVDDSSYWGHNAIIRTAAFTRHCGLPELPGRPPFGGHVMSHDFVEAALMRRAGYGVWLLPELGGSYEEVPPTTLAFAQRDQRWCRGNLQHLAIIGARGLHLVTRLHFFMGALAYGASLLWLSLVVTGLAAALQDRLIVPVYFSSGRSLFPDWQVYDVTNGVRLIIVAALLLWLPKTLGLVVYLLRAPGARVRAVLGFLLESLWAMLIAPCFMLWHSGFILGALLGRETTWEAQQREGKSISIWEALRRHVGHMLFGVGLVAAAVVSPILVAWLAPVYIGLILSPLLTVVSSLPRVADWLARARLLETPEQRRPPAVLALARALRSVRPRARQVTDVVAALIDDPVLNALHVAVLEADRSTPLPSPALVASARRKLSAGARRELTREEEEALLCDPVTLTNLHLEHLRGEQRRADRARPRLGDPPPPALA